MEPQVSKAPSKDGQAQETKETQEIVNSLSEKLIKHLNEGILQSFIDELDQDLAEDEVQNLVGKTRIMDLLLGIIDELKGVEIEASEARFRQPRLLDSLAQSEDVGLFLRAEGQEGRVIFCNAYGGLRKVADQLDYHDNTTANVRDREHTARTDEVVNKPTFVNLQLLIDSQQVAEVWLRLNDTATPPYYEISSAKYEGSVEERLPQGANLGLDRSVAAYSAKKTKKAVEALLPHRVRDLEQES